MRGAQYTFTHDAPRYAYGPSGEPSPRCVACVVCLLSREDGGFYKGAYRYGERGTSSHVRPKEHFIVHLDSGRPV